MRMGYFGDSYDLVKKSLLHWLRSFGEWSVHPMFTECVSRAEVLAFEAFLGAKVISTEVLTVQSNRSAYFASASQCGHLFLDPDTGLRMRGAHGPEYLLIGELLWLVGQRPYDALTIVFDKSVRRGNEKLDLG